VMQTTVSSVESLMHRAKTNLQKKLADYYKDKT
jgi:DNA-directed RNA polymerase specialized sigma24 family protein